MSTAKTLVGTVTRNFFALGVGELIARVIAFGTMVYIARRLGAEAYGVVGFASAVILYFTALADFGIEALGPRDVAEDPERVNRLALPILTARLLIAIGLAAVLALGLFVLPEPDGVVLALFGLTLLPAAASTRWIHLGFERAGHIAVARTVGEGVKAILVLGLVHTAGDVIDVPLAQFAGDACAGLLLFLWLRRRGVVFSGPYRLSEAWPVLRRAWPLVLAALLGLVIYNADLILLRLFRDLEEVGLYLAGFTLITLLGNLGTTYSASLLPTFTRASSVVDQQVELYHTVIAQVFAVSLPLSVGGYLLAPQIIIFCFGDAYAAAGGVLQILLLSVPFLLHRGVLRAVLIAAGRQHWVMWITVCAAVLNIALNLLLIPRFGMVGAAISTVATEVVRMTIVQIGVRRVGFPLTGFGRFWRAIVAVVVMGGVLLASAPASMWIALIVGVVIYLLALGISGGIRFEPGKYPALHV